MTDEQLKIANELKKEILELESFIWSAERVRDGKIIRRTSTFLFVSSSYGAIESKEYELPNAIKNEMLDVLYRHLGKLKKQLAEL